MSDPDPPPSPPPSPPPPPPEFPRYFIIEVVHENEVHFVACEATLSVKTSALPAGVTQAIYSALEAQAQNYRGPLPAAPPALPLLSTDSGGGKNFKMFAMSTHAVSDPPPE